jgi:hypothetical protein
MVAIDIFYAIDDIVWYSHVQKVFVCFEDLLIITFHKANIMPKAVRETCR